MNISLQMLEYCRILKMTFMAMEMLFGNVQVVWGKQLIFEEESVQFDGNYCLNNFFEKKTIFRFSFNFVIFHAFDNKKISSTLSILFWKFNIPLVHLCQKSVFFLISFIPTSQKYARFKRFKQPNWYCAMLSCAVLNWASCVHAHTIATIR